MTPRGRYPAPRAHGNVGERAYGERLAVLQRAGAVAWFRFEGLTLHMADKTSYTPDYVVMWADGRMELHEVKARWGVKPHWEDDARVKVKLAAELFPFPIVAVWPLPKGTGWGCERFA